MAKRYDIRIDQGSTYTIKLAPKDENGTAIDLTSCTAASMLRYAYADASPAATFTASIASNVITLVLSAAQTAALTKTEGVWDCEVTWADASVTRILEGKAYISLEVTK